MGDRSGLSNTDRTNGYENAEGYLVAKKGKLSDQNEEIRTALLERHKMLRTEIFKGISIHVNGKTKPTADELKRLILLNGGQYDPKMYKTTKFMVATNLSFAKTQTLRARDKVVRPEWITESVAVKCLLPYQDYQIFASTAQGQTGSVIDLATDESSSSSYMSRNSRPKKHLRNKQEPPRDVPKCMDIRLMLCRKPPKE